MDDGYWEICLKSVAGIWSPGRIEDAAGVVYDDRCFGRGEPVHLSQPLRLPEYPFGQRVREVTPPLFLTVAVDGNVAGVRFLSSGALATTAEIADALGELAGDSIQRITAHVQGKGIECEIINVTARLDCIDRVRSQIDWWTAENGPTHLAGRPFYVSRLIVDPEAAQGCHIFRPLGWETAVIISTALMRRLREVQAIGIDYKRV